MTHGVPCLTTLSAGVSAARAIARAGIDGEPEVLCLQDLHGIARRAPGRAPASPAGANRPRRAQTRPGWRERARARRPPPAGARPASAPTSGSAPTTCCASRTPDGRGRGRAVRDARGRRADGEEARMSGPTSPVPSRSPGTSAASPPTCSRTSGRARAGSASSRPATSCGCSGRSAAASRRLTGGGRRAARSSSAAGSESRRLRSCRTRWRPPART